MYTLDKYLTPLRRASLSAKSKNPLLPGARPPLAPERGGRAPPCRMKRKNGENQYHRNKKTNRVFVEILLCYS